MHDSKAEEARRKFHAGARLQCAPLAGAMDGAHNPRSLTGNPVQMPEPERGGFTPRAAPRNGDSYPAVALDAQQVSPGARMADEVEGDVGGCRR